MPSHVDFDQPPASKAATAQGHHGEHGIGFTWPAGVIFKEAPSRCAPLTTAASILE